ncbi:RNA exonuclease 1 homolog [Artemia franciscana]|uniref:Exonuclease domain-containing protein n=1 Tax=Artemia franciscana TaxID=6661 RepID=A0AA88IBC4_ARTSF|nr:hypothetical protein QYM36_005884 [Artemia franciscana]
MFPSAGYFRSINCPFYDDEGCERIYCHFRHVPKGLSVPASSTSHRNVQPSGTSIEDLVSQAVKRVLSENDELIRSLDVRQFQQVIQTTVKNSVVEKTAPFQSFSPAPRKYAIPPHVPAYNPTPIKLLEKAKTSGSANIADVYTVSDYSSDKYSSLDSAYKPTSIKDEVEPKFSSDEDEESVEKSKSVSGKIQETYGPAKDVKIQLNYQPSKITPAQGSYAPILDKTSYCLDYKPSRKEHDEKEEKTDAKYELPNVKEDNKYIPSKPKAFEEYNPTKTIPSRQLSVSVPQNESEVSSTTIERAKSSEEAQEKTETKEEEERLKKHSREKNRKRERTVSDERKNESKKIKKKDRSRSSSREKRRHKEKRSSNKHKKRHDRSKSEERKSRSKDRKKRGTSEEKQKIKDLIKDRERKSSKDKERKSSKDKEKKSSKHKDRKSSKEKDKKPSKDMHRKPSKDRERKSSQGREQKYKDSDQESGHTEQKLQERQSKEKRCSKDREVGGKISERDYKSDKHKKGNEKKEGRTKENESSDQTSPVQEVGDDYFPDLSMLEELDDIFEDLEEEDLNNEQLMEECYKIFQEYKPEPNKAPATNQKAQVQETPQIAVESSMSKKRLAHTGYNLAPLEEPPPKIANMNPALVMQERLRLMKEIYMMKKEAAQASKGPQACPTVSSTSEPSTSGSQASAKKRIAHVPNVQGLLKKPTATNAVSATKVMNSVTKYGHTNVKGSQRIAHMPSEALIERPIIAPDSANKVPVTVRQRYLNIIIDHMLSVGAPVKDAYEQAVEEEKAAYSRSGNKSVYLNAIVSAINRLKKAAEGAKASGIQGVKQTVSHLDILAGKGGAKGSWSFERAKKTPGVLSGSLLYKQLEKYALTQEQLESNGFPMPDPVEKGRARMVLNTFRKKVELPTLESPFERRCDRCSVVFLVDKRGILIKKEECTYHWGKPIKRRGIGGLETKYSCCGCDIDSTGCTVGSSHVIEQADLNCVKGFVSTLPKNPPEDGNFGVYALDCEMCYTTGGIELTRLTVIGSDCQIVYETLVMPDNPILDYNTRFSGISEDQLRGVTTSLRDVQAVLLSKFSDKTILIGHSLESDFKALKLIHPTVVDTSVVFPHKMGPPYKKALKTLSADILKKIIQNDVSGHDSAEDAIACMELMLWKVKEDMKMFR